jgi:hypothetical protein
MTILAVTRAIDPLNGTPHKLHQSATDTAMGCSSVRIGSTGSDLLRKRGGQAQTVVTVINLPAVVIDNQCNGEPVALRGRLLTVVTTHPTPNGGTTVRSVSVTQGLEGTGLVSGASYRAVELSGTVVNQLPPPGTGTFLSTVTTRLIPQGSAAPSMLLVVVLKGTVAPDGTISNEVVQTYLVCRPHSAGRAA